MSIDHADAAGKALGEQSGSGEKNGGRNMEKSGAYDPRDAETIRSVFSGNVDAFEDIVDRYGGFVLGIAKKHVPLHHVEDVTQDVFLRVYRSLTMFENRSSFRHWLSIIAVRTCYDFWREQYKSRELPISSLSEEHEAWLNAALADQSELAFRKKGLEKEAREILDWAMERLTPEERMVLELVYLEDRSVKEAAKLLGLSVANVKVRLFRSRKKLHKILEGADEKGGV